MVGTNLMSNQNIFRILEKPFKIVIFDDFKRLWSLSEVALSAWAVDTKPSFVGSSWVGFMGTIAATQINTTSEEIFSLCGSINDEICRSVNCS